MAVQVRDRTSVFIDKYRGFDVPGHTRGIRSEPAGPLAYIGIGTLRCTGESLISGILEKMLDYCWKGRLMNNQEVRVINQKSAPYGSYGILLGVWSQGDVDRTLRAFGAGGFRKLAEHLARIYELKGLLAA